MHWPPSFASQLQPLTLQVEPAPHWTVPLAPVQSTVQVAEVPHVTEQFVVHLMLQVARKQLHAKPHPPHSTPESASPASELVPPASVFALPASVLVAAASPAFEPSALKSESKSGPQAATRTAATKAAARTDES
jgi:hypothetical protein